MKERRRARDANRSYALRAQIAEREARKEAERVVKREEEEQRRRIVMEEAQVRGQMAAIRKQLREEMQRKR